MAGLATYSDLWYAVTIVQIIDYWKVYELNVIMLDTVYFIDVTDSDR